MLTPADLEVNVLEFRHRSFQFDRVAEVTGASYAVFSRTETENERQLRPRLLHLTVVAPLGWIALDAEADLLRIGREGQLDAYPEGTPVEVGAEPSEFEEGGLAWRREARGDAGFLYAPAELAGELLSPAGRSALGLE